MKVLVFSDTHLTNSFEEKKYVFLEGLIQQVDQVIVNGDFWDGHLISLDQFLSSPWNKLFPLLKSKNTVYIYGNHDREEFSNNKIALFSTLQTKKHILKSNDTTFIIEHGNRLLPSFDERLPFPEWFFHGSTIVYTAIERFLTKKLKTSTRFWGKCLNNKLKQTIIESKNYYVFGHTHFAEFDSKHKFIDTGFIQHGLAQYLIIEDGKPYPQQKIYE